MKTRVWSSDSTLQLHLLVSEMFDFIYLTADVSGYFANEAQAAVLN